MLAGGFCECWGKLCVLVVLFVLVDILLLIYYNNMADYSNGVPHLDKTRWKYIFKFMMKNFIVSINIADKLMVSHFKESFVLRAKEWSGVAQGACMSLGTHSQ